MTRQKLSRALLLLPILWALSATGCGTYMAKRMAQAPNSYPQWLAPDAPVLLAYSAGFLTNFPKQFAEVGSPPARLCYRVIEPADYDLKVSSTNWLEHGRERTEFDFRANLNAPTNLWTLQPRGTVLLLHGYALAQQIKQSSGDLLQVEEGSLYPALQRMLRRTPWRRSGAYRRGTVASGSIKSRPPGESGWNAIRRVSTACSKASRE